MLVDFDKSNTLGKNWKGTAYYVERLVKGFRQSKWLLKVLIS